jgi:hypothetical protein
MCAILTALNNNNNNNNNNNSNNNNRYCCTPPGAKGKSKQNIIRDCEKYVRLRNIFSLASLSSVKVGRDGNFSGGTL